MPAPALTTGRFLLTFVSLDTAFGGFLADWNETHIKNPNWPPHARFHNGQTMSLGLCLGLLTGYFAWRPVFAAPSKNIKALKGGEGGEDRGIGEQESITISAVLGTLYWISGLSAILYPGTLWIDPEFGTGAPQVPIFVLSVVAAWVGWGFEMRRLKKSKMA